jgi:hypothetical protein
MTLPTHDFIRRFLMHVLPKGLHRIRHYGLFANGNRVQALTAGIAGTMRARIAAWYTSSFTIGASLSFFLSRIGTLLGWRSAFVHLLPVESQDRTDASSDDVGRMRYRSAESGGGGMRVRPSLQPNPDLSSEPSGYPDKAS